MKAVLASDWHIGLTKPKSIQKLLVEIRERMGDEGINLFIMLGDFCGGKNGARSVATITKMVRAELPNADFLATLGNHDFWIEGRRFRGVSGISHVRTSDMFHANYDSIVQTFKDNNVHFLDKDGPWRDGGFTAIVGHTLWYQAPNPTSNDQYWIPDFIDGKPFNNFLSDRAYDQLGKSLTKLTKADQKIIFASHFPIVATNSVADWFHAGPYSLHKFLKDQFGVGTFLNGHTHKLACIPGHFCCDSDYYKPRYIVIDL